jgi:hypothetical protein
MPKADYQMVRDSGNGYLVLSSNPEMLGMMEGRVGQMDGGQRVSSIQTFDKHHLHTIGAGNGIALDPDMPDYDGHAATTKYGYFELRMRAPNSGDGSHFAWWMTGTQEDAHPDMGLSGAAIPSPIQQTANGPLTNNLGAKFQEGGGNRGRQVYYTTDQTMEFDITENSIDKNSPARSSTYNQWRPVSHKNGSRAAASHPAGGGNGEGAYWYAGNASPSNWAFDAAGNGSRDAHQEFHVYGFEWDETGTKYYLNGQNIWTSPITADYRMLTYLGLYAGRTTEGEGYGNDHGYWPKEAVIDYFRIYKKKEAPRPNSIVLNVRRGTAWDYFQIPDTGTNLVQLSAKVLDQYDRPFDYEAAGLSIKWRFSNDVGGSAPLIGGVNHLVGAGSVTYPDDWSSTQMAGVALNPDTGMLAVSADAAVDQDIFLTAYLADPNDASGYYGGKRQPNLEHADNVGRRNRGMIQETKFVKLSAAAPKAHRIVFDTLRKEVAVGDSIDVSATLYDQYGNSMSNSVEYAISRTITAEDARSIDGITLIGSTLTVGANAMQDGYDSNYLVVTAKAGGRHQNLTLRVNKSHRSGVAANQTKK